MFLEAKSSTSQEDNPNWRKATTGSFSDNYWKEIKVEIYTLESMGNW